jgi:hypothetical protein
MPDCTSFITAAGHYTQLPTLKGFMNPEKLLPRFPTPKDNSKTFPENKNIHFSQLR